MLQSSPRIRMLESRVLRSEGAVAEAGTARSPEIRIGTGRENSRGRMSAHQAESGTGISQETESTSVGGTGTSARDSIAREFGWTTETGHRDETSQFGSSRSESTTSQSQSETSTKTTGSDSGCDEGLSLGLRISPPNPWLLRAAVGTARAERWMAHAELHKEELDLMHDLVETAIELAFAEKIARTSAEWTDTCRRLHNRVMEAADSGNAPRPDAIDASLRLAAAESDGRRSAARLSGLRREFRRLSGVDPAGIPLAHLASGSLRFVPEIPDATTLDEWVADLVDRHPEVQLAEWTRARAIGEWSQSRARRYPWLSQIGFTYEWWEGAETRSRWFEQESTETTFGTTTYTESRTDSSASFETRGPFETETTAAQGSEVRTGTTISREEERESGQGTEATGMSASSEEWWIEARVEIPVFEWFSRESGLRAEAARSAEKASRDIRDVARREIRAAFEMADASAAESAGALRRATDASQRLESIAVLSASQGLAGEMEALRIRERIAETRMRTTEQILQAALDDLAFCRRAGVIPALPSPPRR